MVISEIELYEMLKAKIGNKEAGAFVEILERRVEKKFEEAKQYLATKEDLAKQIGEAKAEIIKWMFIFWVGQMAATVAIVKLIH